MGELAKVNLEIITGNLNPEQYNSYGRTLSCFTSSVQSAWHKKKIL